MLIWDFKMIHHEPPTYYGYKGGYDNVTRCKKCNAIGLYEDCHPANPCYWCGGKVIEYASAKWVRPIRKWSWAKLKFETIDEGYWSFGEHMPYPH